MSPRATGKMVMVQCPGCGAIETVELIGNKLSPQLYWKQGRGGHIYHRNCHLSCRLFY